MRIFFPFILFYFFLSISLFAPESPALTSTTNAMKRRATYIQQVREIVIHVRISIKIRDARVAATDASSEYHRMTNKKFISYKFISAQVHHVTKLRIYEVLSRAKSRRRSRSLTCIRSSLEPERAASATTCFCEKNTKYRIRYRAITDLSRRRKRHSLRKETNKRKYRVEARIK